MRDRTGFRRLGTLGLSDTALSARRRAELELRRQWHSTLGSCLTLHARIEGLERGVLRIALDDPAWRPALEDRLPALMARLDRHAPSLRARRWKIELRTAGPGSTAAREPRPAPSEGNTAERWLGIADRWSRRSRR